jgi:serine/threonine protein kinase
MRHTDNNVSAAFLSPYISRFATDYEPVRWLGAGGFGIVFEARDKLVDIHYAIKRIPLSSSADDKAKVLREVRAHARLSHQNIVRYYCTWLEAPPPGWQALEDIGLADTVGLSIHDPGWTTTYSDITGGDDDSASSRTGQGEPTEYLYIMMELCEHGSLKDWIDQRAQSPRQEDNAIQIFNQICNGIAYIHSQGLIHRDLKPSNIYMAENMCVKIGDFGLTTAELSVAIGEHC